MLRCILRPTLITRAISRPATIMNPITPQKPTSNFQSNVNIQGAFEPQPMAVTMPLRYYSVSAGDIQEVEADDFLGFDKDSYQLIDVRTQSEWDEDHLENAKHIPLDMILNNETDLDTLRSKPCILYCKAGIRSNMACVALRQLGVRAVNLNGGILAVREAQL